MPRIARQRSKTGFYHVMVRGNGQQILFEDEDDRKFYLTKLYFCLKDEGIVTVAWCLMDNHVHLLALDESGGLSTAMARVNGAFARRFNEKNGHVGHVFQDRYRCKPINDERQLLETVRYIHNNPEDAHICRREKYRWSSYQEYMGAPRLVDTSIIFGLLGGRKGFKRFSKEKTNPKLRMSHTVNPSTEVLLDIARDALAPVDPMTLSALSREERNRHLRTLRDTGFSLRQIVRLTGIGKSTIVDATRLDGLADDA